MGTVDHRKIGEGSDLQGRPAVWYTVSITPINRDNITPLDAGQTMAYMVSKEDYDAVKANDIVVRHVTSWANLNIMQVTPSEKWLRE